MMTVSAQFGEYLKQQIKARRKDDRRWSQNELARRATISGGHMSMIVNGRIEPDAPTLKKIASALKVSPEEIFAAAGMLPDAEGELSGEVLDLARAIDALPDSVKGHAVTTTRALLDGLYAAIGERITDGYDILDDQEYFTRILRNFRDNDPEEFARLLAALKDVDKRTGGSGTSDDADQGSA